MCRDPRTNPSFRSATCVHVGTFEAQIGPYVRCPVRVGPMRLAGPGESILHPIEVMPKRRVGRGCDTRGGGL
jgi:hypothetical protein